MGYAVLTMSKLKTMSKISAAKEHNLREILTLNADEKQSHLNEELIPLQKNILEMVQDKIQYRNSSIKRKMRKDATLAIELVTSISNEDAEKINLDEWKKENVKWLQEYFNISPDGKDNVISVVCHQDESRPHIHAIIVPMDEKGEFSAKNFMNPARLRAIQSEYARRMERFGLDRGLEKSVAKKVDIQRFYAELTNNMQDVEDKLKFERGETIEHYHDRVIDFVKDIKGSHMKELKDKDREIVEVKTKLKNYEKTHTMDELVQANVAKKEAKAITKKYEGIIREYGSIENAEKKLEAAKKLNDAIVNCEDKEMQKDFLERMKLLITQEDERKKREKRLERAKEAQKRLERE